MFSEADLRDLLDLKSAEPVLSLYLNTEPSKGNADAYKLRLRSLLKNLNLEEDRRAVENYFDHEYNWVGKSVAVFSCAPQGFFKAFPLALPVHDRIMVSDRAGVNPLANLWENYGGYAVILVDKQGTRLFYFHMGELMEQEGWLGELVKHTKRGGASSFPGRRGGVAGRTDHVEELIDRNMREATQFAITFFEEKHIRRILLGGTEENTTQLRGMLPKAWQSLVIGTFPISMTASHTEVLERTLEIGRQAEQEREAGMMKDLITTAAKGGLAVTGLEKTLDAAMQGRVQLLLASEGFQITGYICRNCHRLLLQENRNCPVCGNAVEKTPDVVDYAISNVLIQKGDVEIVHSNPGFTKAGDIGAFLRY
jgi:peptide chain release factor subunit 1